MTPVAPVIKTLFRLFSCIVQNYKKRRAATNDNPSANKFYKEAETLFHHHFLTIDDVETLCEIIRINSDTLEVVDNIFA